MAVFREDGKLIKTDMDEIEIGIARDSMLDALKYRSGTGCLAL